MNSVQGRTRSVSTAVVAILALAMLHGRAAAGVTRDWTGLANQDWFNVLNWSPSGAPASGDNLRINSGTAQTSSQVRVSSGGALRAAGEDTVLTIANTLSIDSSGILSIRDGAEVLNTTGYLDTISATVSGSNARWVNSGDLHVDGWLTVADAGEVRSREGYVGFDNNSLGWVYVRGDGSQWINSGTLYVRGGSIYVQDGGVIRSARGTIEDAEVTVSGTGSQWINSGDLEVSDSDGTLTIADGGHVQNINAYIGMSDGAKVAVSGEGSLWTNSGELLLSAYHGDSTLTIEAGGQVTSKVGFLGFYSDHHGAATVTGAGSRWTTDELHVGYVGSGQLTVADGGQVSTNMFYGALDDLAGNGTITVTGGAVFDGDVTFDSEHGVHQAFEFGTGGILDFTLSDSAPLGAGNSKSGRLHIADGIAVTSASGYLGEVGHGQATVSGPGSHWNITDDLWVGRWGSGELIIESGGLVSNARARIGAEYGSAGVVRVSGAGSRWFNTSELDIGFDGKGTLIVEAGGEVVTTVAPESERGVILGVTSTTPGKAIITGTGSRWACEPELLVGGRGCGELIVEAGGQLNTDMATIGAGRATVTGTGSRWESASILVGYYLSRGTLTVSGGGKIYARGLSVTSGSTLRLHVSEDDMIVLGDSWDNGSIASNGVVSFYADPFLATGTYRPVSDYSGQSLGWSGSGSYNAVGGAWNSTDKTFVVAAAAELGAGASHVIASGERLIVTDEDSGRRMGVSFGAVASGSFRADLMSVDALSGLALLPGYEGEVLSAWSIESDYVGGEVMLSFDVGLGKGNLSAWRLANGAWTEYDPALATYDSHGIYSFTASGFSGYAVVQTAEPATLGLLVLGGLAVLLRRRK